MYLSESKRNDVFTALRYFKKEEMESAILPFYETARNYLTIPELMEFYSLDEITRAEYDIKHTELLQRDIEALGENRLEEICQKAGIKMKTYQVFYYIKHGKCKELNHIFVSAKNQKEACAICKEIVRKTIGKNAFRPSCKL